MRSVLELARYKVGDSVWWVSLYHPEPSQDIEDDGKIVYAHSKELFESGPFKNSWPYRSKLPRMHENDFSAVMSVITSKMVVDIFDICDVIRSNVSGEFLYTNAYGEWIPESLLFDTAIAARRERTRVLKMFNRWVDSHQD